MEPTPTELNSIVDLFSLLRWSGARANDSAEVLDAIEMEGSDPLRILASLGGDDFRNSLSYIEVRGAPLSPCRTEASLRSRR